MDQIVDFDYSMSRDDIFNYFQTLTKEELVKFAKDNGIRLFSSK